MSFATPYLLLLLLLVPLAALAAWWFDRRRARYAVAFFDHAKLGRGIGRTVTRLVTQYGFDDLALETIELVVLDFNERAQRCYRACGFHEVERIPAGVMDGDRPADDVRMIATRASWIGPA